MAIKNQIASFIYRLIACTFGFVTFSLLYISRGCGWSFFDYDILLTLLSSILLFVEAIVNAISFKDGIRRLPAGLFPPLAFFALVLNASYLLGKPIASLWANISYWEDGALLTSFSAIILPSLCLLDWLLFGEKGSAKPFNIAVAPIAPGLYLLCSCLTRLIQGDEGAAFIKVLEPRSYLGEGTLYLFAECGGWSGVLLFSLYYLCLSLTVALGAWLLSKYLGRKSLSIQA